MSNRNILTVKNSNHFTNFFNYSFLVAILAILGLTSNDLNGQNPGDTLLTVANGTTDTWMNTTGSTITLRITAVGAGGGNGDVLINNNPGGSGAIIAGEFTILNGETIRLIAGAPGTNSNGATGGGGGGASGVVNCGEGFDCATGTVLVIAAGGGGGGLGTLGSDDGLGGSGFISENGSPGNGGTGNSGAGGGGNDTDGEDGVAGFIIATGGAKVDPTDVSFGGTGAADLAGVTAGDGGDGMGGGGGGGLSEGGGGGGYVGGNAGGLILGESGGSGGLSYNNGINQLNIYGSNGGGANEGEVIIEYLGSPLPVELLNFEASVSDKLVNLNWETASELNNMGFYVQHSADAGEWEDIDFIDGQGSSDSFQQYGYIHENPKNGENYYRLKQIDFDGTIDYSIVVVGMIDSPVATAHFYPNPVNSGNVNIQISGLNDNEGLVNLYDATGKKVIEKLLSVQDQQRASISLNIDELPSGMYTAMIIVGKSRITEKIMVAKR